MSELDWSRFESLPGDPTKNWERLCRELIKRNFARYGSFRSVAQQPGVEFHLDLGTDCSLGGASRHWGWQCRWYDIRTGRPIGVRRRRKVEEAIRTTEDALPELTDWVLWTRRQLTPADQKWFYEISTRFDLQLWHQEDVIGLLTGEAEILRATYFGELVLGTEQFQRMHDEAIAPISKRWDPELHVEVEVERELKASLGVPGTWPILRETSGRLARRVNSLNSDVDGLRDNERELARQVSGILAKQSEHLEVIAKSLDEASVDGVRKTLDGTIEPTFSKRDLRRLAGTLRTANHPASHSISAAIWEIGNYFSLMCQLDDRLKENFIAVVGDAGFGKTYLAAELTKVSDDCPGGVLLLAKNLASNGTLDDLARRVPFRGERMEQLIEAVDAAGARLDRRIPIVIDGLNESENPRDWHDILARLKTRLSRTSNCVVIVTLRSAVEEDALPADSAKLRLTGFEYEAEEAIRTYFDYYKIDATDAQLPWSQFTSPLFLRLFCIATNPDRQEIVGVERIPRSLTAVFEKYREVVVSRAAEALSIARKDVESALERVGLALWDQNARALEFDELRQLVGDQPREWTNSLARVLEEEGVLSRDPYPQHAGLGPDGRPAGNQVSAILYDAFAGFVIADAIISQQGQAGFNVWASENSNSLDLTARERHPLADDILNSFVGLLPRRFHRQMWKLVPSPLKERALIESTNLEASHIDSDTREELFRLCKQSPTIQGSSVFTRLQSTRASTGHPLNAGFLHDVLTSMAVGERDLKWSEWLRANRDHILPQLRWWRDDWMESEDRDEADFLFARWCCWVLTSTDRQIRDEATRTLYCYGIGAPGKLFTMAAESLSSNDPYVPERMFAAAYGVLMGQQLVSDRVGEPLKAFLKEIGIRLLAPESASPANHWMTRHYTACIVDIAMSFLSPSIVQHSLASGDGHALGLAQQFDVTDDEEQFDGYFDHDFENDELGRLFPDRAKYDDDHPGFRDASTRIRGRIWSLGWRADKFEEIDKHISESGYPRRHDAGATDRYAMKYARIGLQEVAGSVLGLNPGTRSDRRCPMVDIDPSFPRRPPAAPVAIPTWLDPSVTEDLDWLRTGIVAVSDDVLRVATFGDDKGPWLAVDGYLSKTDKIVGRRVFGILRALLVAREEVSHVVALVESKDHLGNFFLPEEPSDYYTYAGEIPWSDRFAATEDSDEEFDLYRNKIGGHWGNGPVVEVLSHRYSWEDYHSTANRAGGFSVPSKTFSHEFGLRSAISSLCQHESNGDLAAIPFAPPEGFDPDGSLFYLREDLVRQFAESRNMELIWVVWGERHLTTAGYNVPDSHRMIYQQYENVWRRITALSDLGETE